MRLFYKGVELENILYWEARHPDFHNITFTAEGDFVEFKIAMRIQHIKLLKKFW